MKSQEIIEECYDLLAPKLPSLWRHYFFDSPATALHVPPLHTPKRSTVNYWLEDKDGASTTHSNSIPFDPQSFTGSSIFINFVIKSSPLPNQNLNLSINLYCPSPLLYFPPTPFSTRIPRFSPSCTITAQIFPLLNPLYRSQSTKIGFRVLLESYRRIQERDMVSF